MRRNEKKGRGGLERAEQAASVDLQEQSSTSLHRRES